MNRTHRMICAGKLILAAFLLLVPMAQQVKAQGDGGDAGVGVQKAQTLVIFKNSNPRSVYELIKQISTNWGREYKLLLPNSTPRINKALVNLARTEAVYYVARIISLISHNVSRHVLRQRLRGATKVLEVRQRALSRIVNEELAKGARADAKKVEVAATEVAKHAVAISRLGDLLKVMK